MEIHDIEIDSLNPYEFNNKTHPDDQIELIKQSILKFGFRIPILITKEKTIIAGHGRHIAAKKLQMRTVPCIVIDDLTDEEIHQFRIMDNKSAISEFDYTTLKSEYDLFKQNDWNFNLTGFTAGEMNAIFEEENKPIEEKEFDETIEVSHECPKCGYKW